MKALLAWEIGSGQGHIHRLAAIARLLSTHGIEPIFALQKPQVKGINFPWRVLQAPTSVMKALDGCKDIKSYSFTDILYIFSFSEALTLRFHIQAWQNVINLVKPALIFADFAPALVLAASGRVPTVVVGSGFAVPPPVKEFPPIRHPMLSASLKRQSQVAEVVRQVTVLDVPLGKLLNGDRTLIFSIPELDPYRELRDNPKYVGIQNAPLPQNLADKKGSVWGYLSQDWRDYPLIMQSLRPRCEFGELETVLSGKSLAVHHGGSTTSLACLLAGLPQILFPKYQEQVLTAMALEKMGVAQKIQSPDSDNLKEAIVFLPKLFNKAQIWAQKLSKWNRDYLSDTVRACLVEFQLQNAN
jgi:hypothetical protein